MELMVSICKKLRNFELRTEFAVKDEVFALLGASGCGKSMTLKCIAGIETPDSGVIRLGNHVLFDSARRINLPPQQRHVGYLFQNYALFPNMTIAQNIAFVAGGTEEEKQCKVRENIRRFSLEGLEHAYPAALSGGQQQRAAFARILASEAELLMLDEPFSALDSYLKWKLERELMHVLEQYDGAALLVSHDRGEVYRLSDRIAVMEHGHIEAVNTKHELFDNPQTLAGTLLTGCKNVSRAHYLEDGRLLAEEWGMELCFHGAVPGKLQYAGIRAHFFELMSGPGENTFEVEVDQVIEDTFSYLIMVRLRGTQCQTLRWEVDKEEWQALDCTFFYLRLPPEKLILMES
jgi:molybdate transport system ATP-binding protein